MKRRKILKIRILAALMPVLFICLPLSIHAAGISAGASFYSENVIKEKKPDVTFEKGTQAPALDPDDPSKELPLKPGGPIQNDEKGHQVLPGNNDGVMLKVVPYFDFGLKNPLKNMNNRFYLVTPVRPFVQVSDLSGTGNGWKLSVKASVFKDEKNQPSLQGAKMFLSGGTLNTSNKELLNDKDKRPVLKDSVEIAFNGENKLTDIMEAQKGQGMGAWIARWYPEKDGVYDKTKSTNEKSYLEIPYKEIGLGKHNAKLTWVFSYAP